MSKLLTVIGSTGNQGGSVIDQVLGDPQLSKEYKIRGVTRDPSKPTGEKLKSRGVEVVKSKALSRAQMSSLPTQLSGNEESMSKDVEVSQEQNIADAVKEAGVKILIYSSLPNATKLMNGKLPNIAHFDGKAEIEQYAKSIGIPTVAFLAGMYMSNLKSMMRKGEDGSYTLAFPIPPTVPITLFNPDQDTGKFVAGILADPQAYIGKHILGATDWYTPNEIIDQFKEVTGKPAKYVEITEEQFKNALPVPAPAQQELLENFLLIRDYKYFGPNAEAELRDSQKVVRGELTTLKDAIRGMGPW